MTELKENKGNALKENHRNTQRKNRKKEKVTTTKQAGHA